VIGATHHSDPSVPFPDSRPQEPPHGRLPEAVLQHVRVVVGPLVDGPDFGDGVDDGGKLFQRALIPVLYGVLPPAFGVAVSRSLSQHPNRVGPVRLLSL
jgi:hypothetical protein